MFQPRSQATFLGSEVLVHCSSHLYLHGGGLLVPLDYTVLGDKWGQFLSVHRLFHTHRVMVEDLREEGISEERERGEKREGRRKRRREGGGGERRWKGEEKKGEGNLKERDRVNRR